MSQFLENKELFDRVLLLNEEERRNPLSVFEQFFNDYRLHEFRDTLWAMVETCLTTNNTPFDDPDERANLLLRYKEFQRVLEAGNLLLQTQQRA